jgi:hypothetical protein
MLLGQKSVHLMLLHDADQIQGGQFLLEQMSLGKMLLEQM